MRYLGGKHRQAAEIARVITELRNGRARYVEPFVGGGSVLAAVAPLFEHAEASDIVPELIALWRAVQAGWMPPATMSEQEWRALKDSPPSALKGWAAYAASYNGKYFAGYGPRAAGRDYLAESQRGIARKATNIGHVVFEWQDYGDCSIDAETVVYCDPPYAGVESYHGVGEFDHERFWWTVNIWAKTEALVLVHEYTAPEDWIAVHSRARIETMDHGGPSSGPRTESIFVWAGR